MRDGLDIFRTLTGGGMLWIACVSDLEAAKEHIKPAAVKAPGECIVFCQATQEVVAAEPAPEAKGAA